MIVLFCQVGKKTIPLMENFSEMVLPKPDKGKRKKEMMEEKVLIEKSIQGDGEAFETLLKPCKEPVFLHCLSLLHDEEAAKDVMQEAYLHAFLHLNSFKMKSRFSTWFWRIAHNLALNHLKKEQKEVSFQEGLTPFSSPELPEQAQEMQRKLQKAIQHLPKKHRDVIEMYELERIPQKEIAARLKISYGTVRSRLFYARKSLKQFLEEA